MLRFCALLVLLTLAVPCARAASSNRELWLYYPVNLQVPENVDKLEPVWSRDVKAGEARLEPEPKVSLDKPSWKDESVVLDETGRTATLHGRDDGNARLSYKLKLPPFR